MKRNRWLWLSFVCRVVAFLYLVAVAFAVFGFVAWLWQHSHHNVDISMAIAINVLGIALVWACPFCRLADYFERRGDQVHG